MIINPNRKAKTLEDSGFRRARAAEWKATPKNKRKVKGSPAICDGMPLTSFSVGLNLNKLWKGQRQKRAAKRDEIPHTRQGWAEYRRALLLKLRERAAA